MNIVNTDDMKNYLDVDVQGKKPYEDISLDMMCYIQIL